VQVHAEAESHDRCLQKKFRKALALNVERVRQDQPVNETS